MLLRTQLVFFDFGDPLILFMLDYLTVMGLLAVLSYYLSEWMKKTRRS